MNYSNGEFEHYISQQDPNIDASFIENIIRDFLLTNPIRTTKKAVINIMSTHFTEFNKGDIDGAMQDISREMKRAAKAASIPDEKPYLTIARELLDIYDIKYVRAVSTDDILIREDNFYHIDHNENFTATLNYLVSESDMRSYNVLKSNIMGYIRDNKLFKIRNFSFDSDVMNFTNGTYFFTKRFTGFLDVSNPKVKKKNFFYAIPHTYEEINFKTGEEYDCPIFKKLLADWLGDNNPITEDDIFEILGYCLTMNVDFKTAFLIYGPTNSGKTQFLNILKHLVGDYNIAGTEFQRLGSNEFGLEDLLFKIVNICDDLPSNIVRGLGRVKDLTGATLLIESEIKGGGKYRFRPTVKLVFSANLIPMIADFEDDATYGRFILIEFPNQFTKNDIEEEDDDIFKESIYNTVVSNYNEIQGILNNAIKGFERLRKRRGFRSILKDDTKERWKEHSNLAYKFVNEHCIRDNESKIRTDILKKMFDTDDTNPYISKRKFNDLMRIIKIDPIQGKEDGVKSSYYPGIRWHVDYEIEAQIIKDGLDDKKGIKTPKVRTTDDLFEEIAFK
jgi:P4 family phage/plasmid primase-like protien